MNKEQSDAECDARKVTLKTQKLSTKKSLFKPKRCLLINKIMFIQIIPWRLFVF